MNPGGSDDPGDDTDENCSGTVACYVDSDNDDFGAGSGVESAYPASNGTAITPSACASSNSDQYDDTNDDCDDWSSDVNPGGLDDPGDDTDENCSGTVACYVDADDDDFGAGSGEESTHPAAGGMATTASACASSDTDQYDDTNDDCNDSSAVEFPGQVWYPDCDGDGAWSAAFEDVCAESEADALGLCADEFPPDGGWNHDDPGASADCDDEDPDAQLRDACGICGGDGSTCSIFGDGFESGDASEWS